MRKIISYALWGVAWFNTAVCYAVDKFEVLPDLPEQLLPGAEASTVSGNTGASILGAQSVGHEPSIISVVLSLIFVVLLIYLTGILYAKLNKLGFNTLKKQQGEISKSRASVVSTTQLGGNRTLHVVELDGKRMLIGASSGAIQLIKDLGSVSEEEYEEDFSRIEIPNIKIPKIEIPKIEIPSIGFSKIITKAHKGLKEVIDEVKSSDETPTETNTAEEQENQDGIIDSLFTQENISETVESEEEVSHTVDPDEFSLYKKYLS